MLVSVIVPIYDTPVETFSRCLDSIRVQSYREMEIIVVDDGSKEDCSNVYKSFCNEDSRIHYYKTANGGVSRARNYGIDMAKGEYTTFVDSDDLVYPTFIENAVRECVEEDADLVIGLICYTADGGDGRAVPMQNIPGKKTLTDKRQIIKSMFELEYCADDYRVLGTPCGRLYRTEIVKKVRFDESIRYWEDQIFNREVIRHIHKMILIPEIYYQYCQNSYSAMHKKHKSWHEIYEWENFCSRWFYMREEDEEEFRTIYDKNIVTFFNQVIQEGILSGLKYNGREIKTILNNKTFHDFFCSVGIKDFHTFKRFMQFCLMKYKMIYFSYLFAVMILYFKKKR